MDTQCSAKFGMVLFFFSSVFIMFCLSVLLSLVEEKGSQIFHCTYHSSATFETFAYVVLYVLL